MNSPAGAVRGKPEETRDRIDRCFFSVTLHGGACGTGSLAAESIPKKPI